MGGVNMTVIIIIVIVVFFVEVH